MTEKLYTVYKLVNQQDDHYYIDVSMVDNPSKRLSQIKKYHRQYKDGNIKTPTPLNDYLHYYGEHTINIITIGTEQGTNRKELIKMSKEKYGCITTNQEIILPVYMPKPKQYDDEPIIIEVKKKTPEAQLVAVQKWKAKNPERVKAMSISYQKRRYKTDEDFRKKRIQKSQESRAKRQGKLKDF